MNLSDIEKILIIRLSSLGDILLTTPLVRSVKKKYPSIKIDFLLREEYQDTLKLNPYIDNLITFQNNRTDEIKNFIGKNDYDLIIDLQNNLRSAGLLENSKAKKVKYHKKNISKFLLVKFKINFLKNSPPVPVRYASALGNFQLDDGGTELFTECQPSLILNEDSTYIGFAPGAKHFTKRWLPGYFIETGKMLASEGYKIVMFGGRDDRETCSTISNEIPGSIDLSNNNELLQTAADMKKCSVILCNDSGLMHTAAASGVPVAAIFGSTVKEFGFSPYNIKTRIMEHLSLPCRPCTHIGRSSCPKGHFKCMKEITPESTIDNLIAFINS